MASVYGYSFLLSGFNLNRIYERSTRIDFYQDVYPGGDEIDGDIWRINYSEIYGGPETLTFQGRNLSIDPRSKALTGGTITGISTEFDGGEEVVGSYLEGLSLSARDVYGAMLTRSTYDDRALLRSALSGADTFALSEGGNEANGYAGEDKMRGNDGDDRLRGGDGNDDVNGGSGNDHLYGDRGSDRLGGSRGNDRLYGGDGRDTLHGGTGRDRLFAGYDEGRDVIVYRSVAESRPNDEIGYNPDDVIREFEQGVDDIDLRSIDARLGEGDGNDAFSYSGRSARSYSVWWEGDRSGPFGRNDTISLYADVNGDRTADFEVLLEDVSTLSSRDLLL